MKKMLVISHDCSRTGAPILLLRLLNLFVKKENITICNAMRRGGPLETDFQQTGEVYIHPKPFWAQSKSSALIVKGFNYLVQPFRTLRFKNQLKSLAASSDLIFVNTISNGDLLRESDNNRAKVISYIHELKYITTTYSRDGDIRYLLNRSDLVLVPCLAVRDFLVENYSLAPDKIEKLNYYLSDELIDASGKEVSVGSTFPRNTFIIVGCGTSDWRKGFDLFVQTAIALSKKRREKDFHFLWVGGDPTSTFTKQCLYDLEKAKIQTCFTLTGEVDNPVEYISRGSVFFLSSREDPYPVVVLEAAQQRLPVICFEKSGGIVEFVEDDAGWILPYLDVQKVAEHINALIDQPDISGSFGEKARSKLLGRHNASVVNNQLNSILQRVGID